MKIKPQHLEKADRILINLAEKYDFDYCIDEGFVYISDERNFIDTNNLVFRELEKAGCEPFD